MRKKISLLVLLYIFFLIKNGLIFCQDYLTNTTTTPITYNTCGGNYYDDGGESGNYALNINNRITTFCSNDGSSSIKIDFTQFNVEFSYDKLFIYDGPTTASPLIVTLSGNITPGSFISTGTCLTFKFKSDNAFAYPGWKALISCVTKPACATNPAANNLCSSATYISNLNGYCGNTSSSYSADSSPDLLTDFCGSIENNSWLKFTASSTTATFNIWTSNCTVGDGIQIQIYSTTDCISFNPVSNCWNPMYDVNSTITATGLTVGQDYYIMIDGHTGDVCDYLIGGESGMVLLQLDDVDFDVNCIDGEAKIKLTFNPESNYSYFYLEKSNDGIHFENITEKIPINKNNNEEIFILNETNRESKTFYRATILNEDGLIFKSDVKLFKCSNNDFEFFPNPCTDNITILLDSKYEKELIIYDTYGKIVLNKKFNDNTLNETIDISSLSNGMYSIHFIQNDTINVKKLIKK